MYWEPTCIVDNVVGKPVWCQSRQCLAVKVKLDSLDARMSESTTNSIYNTRTGNCELSTLCFLHQSLKLSSSPDCLFVVFGIRCLHELVDSACCYLVCLACSNDTCYGQKWFCCTS